MLGALPYQPALDGIRAVAVLAVIAYHDEYRWARGGFLGVDAFFVLSGFLITTLLLSEWCRHGRIAVLRFWGRRARRLLPAAIGVLLFVAIYTAVVVAPEARRSVGSDGLAALFYVANWRFVYSGQSYFQLFSAPSPLRHVWSLAIEEQFYLGWPIIAAVGLWLGRGSRRRLGAICGVGILGSVVAMAATYDTRNPSRAYYGTDTRAHTLLVGCLLAIWLWDRPLPARRVLRWGGIVAAAVIVVAWSRVSATDSGFYRGGSLIFSLLVAIVIVAILGGGALERALSFRPLVWIGTISYGLYLWHWPLNAWLVESRVGVGGTGLNVIRLIVTFGAATASFYLLERPIRRGRLSERVRWWAAPVAIAATAALVLASTAGAQDAPSYVGGGFGFPSQCRPQPSELRDAVNRQRRVRVPPTATSAHRILLIGDSTACSFYPGLRAVGRASDVDVDQGSVVGCGIVSDEVTSDRAFVVPLGTEQCQGRVSRSLRGSLRRSRPDVVVWLSSWEKSDLRVGGRVLPAGSPQADHLLMRRADAMVAQLTRTGARVVILTQPARSPGAGLGVSSHPTPTDDLEFTRLNQLLIRIAARHPTSVGIVDLAALLCPTGPPCPERVDGLRPRPDGSHFTADSSVWAARWVLPHLP